MKLLVTNIARNLSKEDFEKVFAKFGPLQECTLVLDSKTQKSKGFGFVVIEDEALAQKAIEFINGRLVNGQKIKVKKSQ
jgi:RNA recognition motif-containing protein